MDRYVLGISVNGARFQLSYSLHFFCRWTWTNYSLYLFCRLARANSSFWGFDIYFNMRCELLTLQLLSRLLRLYSLKSAVTWKLDVQVWFKKVARWLESLLHSMRWLTTERVSFLFKIRWLSIQRWMHHLACYKFKVNWFSLWLLTFIVLIVCWVYLA